MKKTLFISLIVFILALIVTAQKPPPPLPTEYYEHSNTTTFLPNGPQVYIDERTWFSKIKQRVRFDYSFLNMENANYEYYDLVCGNFINIE